MIKLPVGLGLAVGVGWGAGGAWLGLTVEIAVLAAVVSWRLVGEAWLPEALRRPARGLRRLPLAAK